MHVCTPVLTLLSREVHPLLPSFAAFDSSSVFCYWQQPPALPRNLLPSVSCPLQPSLTTAVQYGPRNISQFPLLRSRILCLYQLPPYFTHRSISAWPRSESPITAPPLRGCPGTSIPSLPPAVPQRTVETSKVSTTGWSKANPFSNPTCSMFNHAPGGDRHECPKPIWPMPPLPGQAPQPSPSPVAKILEALIFQPVSSGDSLRATWWTKGTFSPFYFTENEGAPGKVHFRWGIRPSITRFKFHAIRNAILRYHVPRGKPKTTPALIIYLFLTHC